MSRHIIYAISKIGIMAAIIMACLFAPSVYAQDTVKLSEEMNRLDILDFQPMDNLNINQRLIDMINSAMEYPHGQ